MREYITYSVSEFRLLGRKDLLTGGKPDTDRIIKTLMSVENKKFTLLKLRDYLIGYRLGKIESIEENSHFDIQSGILISKDKMLPDETIIEEATQKAKKLINGGVYA